MKPVEPNWDERTDPRCEANQVFAVGDTLGALIFTGLGVAVAVAGHGDERAEGAALSGVMALGLGVSAGLGYSWSARCDEARATWDRKQIEQDAHLHPSAGPPVRRPVESVPRGFFCASSASTPAAGFCTRGKVACVTARDAVAAGVADIGPCALTEAAWCLDDVHCAPAREVCEEQRAKRVGSDGNAAACAEQR